MKKINRTWKSLLFSMLVVPLLVTSAFAGVPTIRIDMDPITPGVQTVLSVNAGDTFTTNVEMFLPDNLTSMSAFSFSLLWDSNELATPVASDITSNLFAAVGGWTYVIEDPVDPDNNPPLPYASIDAQNSLIRSFTQVRFTGANVGPRTSVIASINWKATNPITDSSFDITPGNFDPFDGINDRDGNNVVATFEGGQVHLAPEPVSSTLFVIGGLALGARRFLKKK